MSRILVVEDDRDIRELLVDSLVDLGHQVFETSNGGAGLEKALLEVPDLILLDVMMPVMDGLEVLERLKKDPSAHSIPVIMVSARGQEQDAAAATKKGAWGYIVKPWDADELEYKVSQAIATASGVG